MRTSYGMLGEFNQSILSWLQQPSLLPLRHVLEDKEAYHLFVEARIQVLLALVIVIFTKDLVLLLIIAIIHAVSGETPELTAGGGIKQSSHRQVAHLSVWCFNESSVPCGYWSVSLCFSSSLFCSPNWPSSPDGWWQTEKNLGDAELSLNSLEIAISSILSCLPL